ncbi:MAG: hypothetical protein M3464_12160, partial [Chloroflexota bacterium]|nr:hypothetical protein [Chloroflexota bacterium]
MGQVVHSGWSGAAGVEPDSLRLTLVDPLGIDPFHVPCVFNANDEVADDIKQRWPGPPALAWIEGAIHPSPRPQGCLQSFLKLGKATDGRIMSFAQRWGPLGICVHGRPSTHAAACVSLGSDERVWEPVSFDVPDGHIRRIGEGDDEITAQRYRRTYPRSDWAARSSGQQGGTFNVPWGDFRVPYWEPLAAWRFHASQLRAAWSLGVALSNGQATKADDWLIATNHPEVKSPDDFLKPTAWEFPEAGLGSARQLVALPVPQKKDRFIGIINGFIREAGVISVVRWGPDGPSTTLTVGAPIVPTGIDEIAAGLPRRRHAYQWQGVSLYGLLVCQLVAAVTNPKGMYTCSICQSPFSLPPEGRRRRLGQGVYCSDDCRYEAHKEQSAKSFNKRKPARKPAVVAGAGNGSVTPTTTPQPANDDERPRMSLPEI